VAAHKAHGLVSVAGNAWPEATRRYVQRCLDGAGLDPISQSAEKSDGVNFSLFYYYFNGFLIDKIFLNIFF
jgi:hypothetical protein